MYPFKVNDNHWTLLYIDKEKRTVEYYDSLFQYGNYSEIVATLQELTENISKKDPIKKPFQFIPKILKKLQNNGYDCGVFVVYFLEERAKNPEIDFNQRSVNEMEEIIFNYRRKLINEHDQPIHPLSIDTSKIIA